MDLLSVIRRWRHWDKLAIREIRHTRLWRNTIRGNLASTVTEPTYPARPARASWLQTEVAPKPQAMA